MKRILISVLLLFVNPFLLQGADYPITFNDSTEAQITLSKKPQRVVSLVPSVSEILIRLGVEDVVVGSTHHSLFPPGEKKREIVGGFFRPDFDRVEALAPDLIFYAELHSKMPRLQGRAQLVCLSANSIAESFEHLMLLGKLFDREQKALEIIVEQKRQLAVIKQKIGKVVAEKRHRVIRLMGSDPVLVPGDDSFQNEYIRAAGGIAPEFGRNGKIITLNKEEWYRFNAEIIYSCGNDKEIPAILEEPGWKDVDAVKNKRILSFPCALTCRASTHTGDFVAWLAASLYGDEFGRVEQQVLPERVVKRKKLPLGLDYVEKAEILESDIRDFRSKSVVLKFDQPMHILSTLEGWREKVKLVGNHYWPPPTWGLGHSEGLAKVREHTLKVLGMEDESASFLFTGANMDNLAVVKKSFREMEVTALVTAGVAGNALRMGADEGSYYELDGQKDSKKPGTINILLLTNKQLTPRAMTRAMISATEGKTAALQDLDIRSSYTPKVYAATGTGTDNILVVEGRGLLVDASGGHTKMGELIARAVYDGVLEAVRKQNGFMQDRSVFQRLKERKSSVRSLCKSNHVDNDAITGVEQLLLDSRYSSFLEAALFISDGHERGSIEDLSGFDTWCASIAEEIAGKPVEVVSVGGQEVPVVLRRAMGALLSGVRGKQLQ